jgi:hypothetical protein
VNLKAFMAAGAVALAVLTAPAHAARIDITELPGAGAGSLLGSAQVTTPGGAVINSISGMLDPEGDIDLYAINVSGNFFATTSGSLAADLGLWLFDRNGRGVQWASGNTFDDGTTPQALLSLTNVTSGLYFLAVGRSLNTPFDASGSAIFDFSLEGPLSLNPLASWTFDEGGGNFDRESAYRIIFEAGAFGVPEPATGALLGLGLLAAALARRRRAR